MGSVVAGAGVNPADQRWGFWPLLPLYPYGRRRTLFSELIPGQLWSLEQLQGVYYVAVPVRLTVAKVPGGLMLVNPLPPTGEVRQAIAGLEQQHGPVRTIVLPTASGLEHKLPLGPLARAFPDADIWVCPGQWSFPVQLPLSWLGVPARRTKVLFDDGLPHGDVCEWFSLGPLDLGVGRFQEVSCLHRPSGALLVTDALVGISAEPPALFDLDPTPLLFHARERGDEPLIDSAEFAAALVGISAEPPALFDLDPTPLLLARERGDDPAIRLGPAGAVCLLPEAGTAGGARAAGVAAGCVQARAPFPQGPLRPLPLPLEGRLAGGSRWLDRRRRAQVAGGPGA